MRLDDCIFSHNAPTAWASEETWIITMSKLMTIFLMKLAANLCLWITPLCGSVRNLNFTVFCGFLHQTLQKLLMDFQEWVFLMVLRLCKLFIVIFHMRSWSNKRSFKNQVVKHKRIQKFVINFFSDIRILIISVVYQRKWVLVFCVKQSAQTYSDVPMSINKWS